MRQNGYGMYACANLLLTYFLGPLTPKMKALHYNMTSMLRNAAVITSNLVSKTSLELKF